ncbi:MAG: zinc ribbon domain-containing protein [Rhodobiaceae bacterium]|nr:zinc ribbon domain-containing protein [Rhodobiaceae bacterium]MCC0049836.1 zinc ribbon domain-containing protein [Rhodobiaceae bacterium]
MGLLDILSKLGILRFGARKGVYHSGKDMPPEFLMDDVFDAGRDLTTKEDLRKAKNRLTGEDSDTKQTGTGKFCTGCGAELKTGAKFCSGCGKHV